MKKIFTLALASVLSMGAMADTMWWGYGDGENIAGGVGTNSNATWTAAIKMPQNLVNAYAGSQITGIRFATYGNSGTVKNVSYFVTDDITNIQNPESVGTLKQGWHEYQLLEPYTIEAGKDLYIGYTSTAVYPVAIVDGEGCEGSCVIGYGDEFYDYGVMDGMNWVLGVQALLSSESFPAGLSWKSNGAMKIEADKDTELTFDLQTTSPAAVTSYNAQLSIDGTVINTQNVTCDLQEAYAPTQVTFNVPAQALGEHMYTVAVTAINGETLAAPVEATGDLTVVKVLLPRKQVVEECTGTWCPWCVRGIVALREMKAKYPDSFIGIAVHANDSYATSTYNSLLNRADGYPYAFINRESPTDTNPSGMEADFLKQDIYSDGEVKIVEARFTDETKKKLTITTKTRFAKNYSSETYRLAFVILEDYLSAVQQNAYAGGGYGQMGGFENMGSAVKVDLMDVARDIKSYTGLALSVPSKIEAGEEYEYTYTYTLPTTIAKLENVSVVALLQTKNGKTIINADKTETLLEYNAEGIEEVKADATNVKGSFDLMGRRIAQPVAGKIYVEEGKLKLMK